MKTSGQADAGPERVLLERIADRQSGCPDIAQKCLSRMRASSMLLGRYERQAQEPRKLHQQEQSSRSWTIKHTKSVPQKCAAKPPAFCAVVACSCLRRLADSQSAPLLCGASA